jgi:integrase
LANPKGGQWNRHCFREQALQPATDAAEYEMVGFHMFRHTAISLMCRARYRPECLAERVGHADCGAFTLSGLRLINSLGGAAPEVGARLGF